MYSYTSKFSGMKDFVNAMNTLEQRTSPEVLARIKTLLTDKSLEPQEKILKLKALSALISSCAEEDFVKYLDLIKSHTPTKEDVQLAKKILDNPKARFDDKFRAFCDAFGIDKNDQKIIAFFEKRSQVNEKGYKVLNGVKAQEISKLLEIEVYRKRNYKAWQDALNKFIFKKINVEYSETIAQKLNLTSNRFFDKILTSNNSFYNNLKLLVKELEKYPDKSVREVLDMMPHNIETKRMFERYNIDYNKYVDFDKDSFVEVIIEKDIVKQQQTAVTNLEADFLDPAFKAIPDEEKEKIFKALQEIKVEFKEVQEPVYDGNGYLISEQTTSHFFIDGTPVTFNKLPKIISTIKKAMNGSEFWTKTASDSNLDSARKTIYDHIFELRSGEISATEKLKSSTVSTLKIRKTDMNDVTHSLTLGNDAHCCTRAGSGCNQFAAPRYIMDKFISAIEIMDGNISVGNSMCFFAEVNGQLAFVIDNIEVTAGYQYDDTLRDAFMQYAKQMCDEMGLTDIPIYAGPNRHKFKMKYETISKPEVKIIGSTGGEITYIDSVSERMAIDGETVIVPDLMFRIR